MNITDMLFSMKDEGYRVFQARLMPTVDPDTIIGVRTPALRSLARELSGTAAEQFLRTLPHRYYEENNLHAFLIERIKDYDECIAALERFLPYVDNWATCDGMRPSVLKKHKDKLLYAIDRWLLSDHAYTVRFGIECLMCYYLDDGFDEAQLARVGSVESGEYYVRMMVAWYFATALAKRWDAALPYIEGMRLSAWVHNKTIRKACESYRLSTWQKERLKSFKIR